MSRALTKAQLAAELEAAHVAYDHLSTAYQRLARERDEMEAAARVLSAPRQQYTRGVVTPEQQAAHDTYVSTLLRAKELAMRSGKSVRVG